MPELDKIRGHASRATGTEMEFSIFLPPQAGPRRCPVVFHLSGLTCNWANVTERAASSALPRSSG